MADVRRALHPEDNVFGLDAEFMLEHPPGPEGRGLLVFGHADAPAPQVGWRLDAGILADQDTRVEKTPGGKHR